MKTAANIIDGSHLTPKDIETRLLRKICKRSFYRFVQEFWHTIIPETPVWNWHIQYLCGELQMIAQNVFEGKPKKYDLLVNISPSTSKSSLISIFFPIWVWTHMPSARVITASYTGGLAYDFSRKSRDIIRNELYQQCYPEIKLDVEGASYYTNTLRGERYSVGVRGMVTGKHAHFIIIDDPLNPMEASSEAEMHAANIWLHETIATRKVDASITPTIMIMQRLHQDDPTGNWLSHAKEGTYKHICLPADCSEGQMVLPPKLKEYYKDGLFDPVRLPKNKLEEYRSWMGEFGYACQYDQHPIPRSGGMFLTDRLQIRPVDPNDPITFTVRYWDKAISTSKSACYTVGAKLGRTKSGKFYVLDIVRGRWDSDARERMIKITAEADGRGVLVAVEMEPGSGGQESALYTVRNLAGFNCKIDKADTHKEVRAEPFSSQVNGYNVSLVPAEWNAEYISELRFFPSSKYKDQVDASSGAFNMISQMSRRRVGGWS